jgi:tRNA pseudouridine55 synthase
MDGLLVVDKPVGPTSHDIVDRIRRSLGERRIGHTGTLDPGASGVLALVIGRATRLARFMSADKKAYEAVVRLGVSTDTYDGQGRPTGAAHAGRLPSRAVVEQALESFLGTTLQRPPAYSAKKIAGQRSYALARRRAQSGDEAIAPMAVPVSVDSLHVTSYSNDIVGLAVTCSAGFYVRSLAHDLGERLGTGAHLASLQRTQSGEITLVDAHQLASVEESREAGLAALVPMSRMLIAMPSFALNSSGMARIANGRDVGRDDCVPEGDGERGSGVGTRPNDTVRLLGPNGDLVAIALVRPAGVLHPSVVLK